MTIPSNPAYWGKPLAIAASILTLITVNACRSSSDDISSEESQVATTNNLSKNNLENAAPDTSQSTLLLSQTQSPIHWQPWSKSVFDDAAKANKTVFAYIASGTNPNALESLAQLNQSAKACANLNKHHVNILVDSNLHPDLEFFTASLCRQSRTQVSSPLLVWFSHEGIPISWIPINNNQKQNASEFIIRTSNIVARMWKDSPKYVLKNSREDFIRRKNEILPAPLKDENNLMAIRATRQVASLFDPTTSTIDGIGNLSIGRYIELLAVASQHPDLTDTQKKRYTDIAALTADNMLLRGLIDPLDGGIFSGIQQSTTALPVFSKKLKGQAYTMAALYSLYQTSGETRYLKAADAILSYTEKNLTLPDEGYSLGIVYANNNAHDNPCIWTLEELESALTPEEVKLAKLAFGIQGLGNIPLVDDRNRSYFSQNTLIWKLSPSELSTRSGIAPAALTPQLESITKKLSKLRTDQSTNTQQENLSTLETSSLLAQAFTVAYRATGDTKYLDRAIQTLTFIREKYIDDAGTIHHARFKGKLLTLPALGADYTQFSQAALDLHQVTLDPEWLNLASDTHQRMLDQLGNTLNYHISENPGTNNPYPYTPYQFISIQEINNTNTWALAYSNAKRLSIQNNNVELNAQSEGLLGIMLATTQKSPLPSMDFLISTAKLQQPKVYLRLPFAPKLLTTAIRKRCQIIGVAESDTKKQYPELGDQITNIPDQGAIIIQRGKIIGTTTSAEELNKILP